MGQATTADSTLDTVPRSELDDMTQQRDGWHECADGWRAKFEESETRAGVALDEITRLNAEIAELQKAAVAR